tara:strand:+ start:703 stop:1440 length:738 start_codon:yes stop_codon:yes gene_type:complete
MALTFGTDLTVTGNIKLTEVQLVQGAWRTLSGSAATGSVPIQRIEDGQLYYLESENKVVKATVTFNSETFQNEATFADFAWPSATSASYAVTASYAENAGGGGGGGGITISNNVDNRVLTGDGSNANAEAGLTFDGTTLTLGANTTASFQRIDAQVISASVVEVDASTLKIGGTAINKTLVDNIKQTFSDTVAQTSDTVTTTAATGSFSGHISSSKLILDEQTTTPTAVAGGMIFSGSAFYLGFE